MNARQQFIAAIAEDEPELARACLLIAAEEYPALDVEGYLERLDVLADAARPRVEEAAGIAERVDALADWMYQDAAFRGNAEEYYDPRNSFLNEVLDRRTGLPITLSIVMIELGRRLDVPLFGVNFPGHFLVGYREDGELGLRDPFHEGAEIPTGMLAAGVATATGVETVPLDPAWLQPAPVRLILLRVLNNLRGVYMRAEDWGRAQPVLERMLLLEPTALTEWHDLAVVAAARGDLPAARRAVRNALALVPARAEDNPWIAALRQLQATLGG
jgi:regulator of sirC expression with transglutaminase-like and TPR domain